MLKKTLIRSGIGFVLGILIGYAISFLTGLDNPDIFISVPPRLLVLTGSVTVSQILQGVFSGLYGAICFGTMSFYEIERWPLVLATGAHCAVIVLLYIPVGLFLGWLDNLLEILIVAGCQIVGFFIVWLIMNAIYKKQVKELNDLQKEFNDKEKQPNAGDST